MLPKFEAYELKFAKGMPRKRLKRVREELQCVGPHVKKLRLSEEDESDRAVNLVPYMQQCKKYVGASLKEVDLDYMPFDIFSGRNLEIIQLLFRKIESLSMNFLDESDYEQPIDVDLSNLKELTLDAYMSPMNR